jgi:hypothetical protein
MSTTAELIQRLTQLRDNMREVLVDSIEETASIYVDLNTEQMYVGKDGTGRSISPMYKFIEYANQKSAMNPAPGFGVPDLKLTGAFYEGYTVHVEGDQVIKDSTVEYADKLFEKYGNAIGELDDDFHQQYVEGDLAPVFMDKVREITGLS